MKRILVILAALSLMCSCYPLTIVMNSINSKGERTILTSNQPLFSTGRGSFDIALGTRIAGKDTVLAFLITADTEDNHGIFNLKDRLMFKLGDGSKVVLTNVYDKEFESHTETEVSEVPHTKFGYAYSYSPWAGDFYVTPYTINHMVTKVRTRKVNNSFALYLASKEQLANIIGKGVKKLRVEVEDNEYDMPNTDSVSSLVRDLSACLVSGIQKKHVRKEF